MEASSSPARLHSLGLLLTDTTPPHHRSSRIQLTTLIGGSGFTRPSHRKNFQKIHRNTANKNSVVMSAERIAGKIQSGAVTTHQLHGTSTMHFVVVKVMPLTKRILMRRRMPSCSGVCWLKESPHNYFRFEELRFRDEALQELLIGLGTEDSH